MMFRRKKLLSEQPINEEPYSKIMPEGAVFDTSTREWVNEKGSRSGLPVMNKHIITLEQGVTPDYLGVVLNLNVPVGDNYIISGKFSGLDSRDKYHGLIMLLADNGCYLTFDKEHSNLKTEGNTRTFYIRGQITNLDKFEQMVTQLYGLQEKKTLATIEKISKPIKTGCPEENVGKLFPNGSRVLRDEVGN